MFGTNFKQTQRRIARLRRSCDRQIHTVSSTGTISRFLASSGFRPPKPEGRRAGFSVLSRCIPFFLDLLKMMY